MATALSWPGKEKSLTLGRELAATAGPGFTAAGGRLGEGIDGTSRPRTVVPDTDENLLIVGDNLPGLQSLLATHRGRVKVVYIDPPYNTGNAHAYLDRGHDHDSWLDFMAPRLILARELMRDDGVLYLHLDDGESAWAQLLGHEVFGEANSLGTLIHQRAKGGGNSPSFVRGHDYIHVWGKDARSAGTFLTEKKAPAKVEVIDGRKMLVETDVLRASFGRYARGSERRLMYEDILAVKGEKKLAEVDAKLASGEFVLRPWGPGKHAVVRVTPYELASSKLYSIIKALGGQNDLEDLGLGGVFGYPKPVELVKTLITAQTFFDPTAIVLDFFAGSGTTAQAVMEANRRDDGQRSFILIQTPEELRGGRGASGGRGGSGGRGARGGAGAGVNGNGGRQGEADVRAASGSDADSARPEFATISELTAERIRRAADASAPGLTFTEVAVADPPAAEA
ncbi:site-specific DNA-methyltransferase [Brevibacterium casei]|uniref:site-specific DNA-methyltransferase n=1 Tax=Brevibacterium casei TaxID=33889 RepID=UPI001CE576FD|nr:site-specific DNA-methyltransferase [Brevibacterium casei]QZE26038.1 site-specific DNA-methyltransferase [Brevibacterium casei]